MVTINGIEVVDLGNLPNPIDIGNMKRATGTKITEDEVLAAWKVGLNDCEIARYYGCASGIVAKKRYLMHLVANAEPPSYLKKIETNEEFEGINNLIRNLNKDNQKKYNREHPEKKIEITRRFREKYKQINGKVYHQKEKSEYDKKYYLKNQLRIKEYNKKRYQKIKENKLK